MLRSNLIREDDWCLAFDLWFVAMRHRALGETARAQDCFDWAVRRIGSQVNSS